MKYLLINDTDENGQDILDSIAGFLWDNGHTIFTRTRFQTKSGFQDVVEHCDGFVVVSMGGSVVVPSFLRKQVCAMLGGSSVQKPTARIILVFSGTGVYCNAIPFPHKIFHFERLCQDELARFFRWCRKLNLFTDCIPQSQNRMVRFL